jgi:hypothetical protein
MTINTALHQRVSTFSERCLGYQDGPAREPWLLQWSELRLVHLRFPRHSVFFRFGFSGNSVFPCGICLNYQSARLFLSIFSSETCVTGHGFNPPMASWLRSNLNARKQDNNICVFFCVNRILIHCHLTVTWCYLCPHVCWLYPKFSWFLPSKFERCVHPHWSMGSRI